jgi:SP family general alpha glucoside:H+ symporter-like MFS transporter
VIALVISYVAITLEIVASGAHGNGIFFAGRFLNGFVVGLLITVCSSYIGEIAPLALRGLMTAMIAFVYAFAPLIVSLIVNATGTQTTPWAYRTVFVTQYGFCAVATVCIPWMPESPWWLASRGRDDDAIKSLRKLGSATDIEANHKLGLIKVTLEKARQETEGATYLECFRSSNLRRTIVSIVPLSIQAMGGILFMNGYMTYYAQLAGYSAQSSYYLTIIYNVLSICGCICSWFVIDRVGRRNLTLGGTAALTAILLIAGGLATTGKPALVKGVVAMMMIYTFVYSITIGSTAYTILTENATSRLRVKTIGIGVAVQGIWYTVMNIALPYLFNPNYANLGAKVVTPILSR